MNNDDFDYVNDVLKRKISEIQDDVAKLKAVDSLIGEQATEQKKHALLDTVFALQDVQTIILDERFNRQSNEAMRNALMPNS